MAWVPATEASANRKFTVDAARVGGFRLDASHGKGFAEQRLRRERLAV